MGAFMAFWGRMGVSALWWGLTVGLLASSTAYVALLACIDWAHEARIALLRYRRCPHPKLWRWPKLARECVAPPLPTYQGGRRSMLLWTMLL